jgi:hypothetical protein
MRRLFTVAALSASVLVVTGSAGGRHLVPGLGYKITSSSTSSNPMGSGMSEAWSASVVYTGARGRMDMLEGVRSQIFAAGDYILYDSADVIVVHPASKTFSAFPINIGSRAAEMMRSSGMQITFGAPKVSVETLSVVDTVAGYATRHSRTKVSTTITMDMMGNAQSITMDNVIDRWVARVPGFPPNPLIAMAGGATENPFMSKEMTQALAAARPLPGEVALRTKTSGGMMSSMGGSSNESVVEITDIKRIDVDPAKLVLPAGYTEQGLAMFEQMPGGAPKTADGGAKWRVPPR